jgi:hypothetical protein
MRPVKRSFWVTAFAVVVSATAALFAQGFNARTGTWEFTMTVEGAIPMEGIPANMRPQLEAEMRKPHVVKSCVTADDLKSLKLGKTDDGGDDDCKVLTSKISGTVGDVVRQCTGDKPRTETAHYEAPTPQTLKASISSKSAAGTMTTAVTGKWLAATCKE